VASFDKVLLSRDWFPRMTDKKLASSSLLWIFPDSRNELSWHHVWVASLAPGGHCSACPLSSKVTPILRRAEVF
jgi:hypothetical protein